MSDRHSTAEGSPDKRRQYTLSITEEDRQRSFEHEDERWERHRQVRDWLLLGVAALFWVAFQLSFFFLVPGIK